MIAYMSLLNTTSIVTNMKQTINDLEWEREKAKPVARKRKDSESSEVKGEKKKFDNIT